MKVLFVSTSSGSRGGGELFLCFLGEALRELGHEPVLWMSNHERMDELEERFAPVGAVHRSPYVNTYDYRLRSIRHTGSLLAPPRHYLREWQALAPDVIHLNKQCLEDGLDLMMATRGWKGPQVCTVHITQSARYLKAQQAGARDWISRRILRRYRGTLISFSNRLDELRDFVGRAGHFQAIDNGVVIPSAAERQRVRAEARARLGLSPDEVLILGLGRIEDQKRPLEFVRLAELAHRRFPRPKIWWVGAGRMEAAFDAAVAQRSFTTPVERLGWQSEVQPYLAAADLFIHAAAFEGLPFGLLEALAWGCPCVIREDLAAALPPSCREACTVAGPGDDTAWLDALLTPAAREAQGAAGRAIVARDYSREAMARAYVETYRAR